MDNVQGLQESALLVIGGLVVEVNPTEIPAGSAPICCDFDFTVASGITRDGLANVFVNDGADEELEAGSGINVVLDPPGANWSNPSNITHDNPPNYASVTLNATPVAVAANNQQNSFHANGITFPITAIADNSGNPGVWATLTASGFSQNQLAGANTITVTGFTHSANNGTFALVAVMSSTQVIVVCTCVNETHAASGTSDTGHGPSWTSTITASGSPINVGDTLFLQINGADPFGTPGSPITIASVTDDKGNTWAPVAPAQVVNSGRGFVQMWYARMGTQIGLGQTIHITANEDTSGTACDMNIFAAQNFAGVGTIISFVQNAGTNIGPWSSGSLSLGSAAFLLSWSYAASTLATGPSGFTVPQASTWGSNGGHNSEGQYGAGGPGSVDDSGWTQSNSNEFASTLAAFTVATTPTASFSNILEASGYGFTIPLSSEILGVQLVVKGKQSSIDPSSIFTVTPIGGGAMLPFQLETSQSDTTLGGPNEFVGTDALTPANVNSNSFGFDFEAFSAVSTGVTFDLSAAVVTVWYTPPGLENYDFVGTFAQTDGTTLTIALDNTGVLWKEDIVNTPDILMPFYTAIEPDTFARAVTQDDRFFMAFSDRQAGTDMPRGYNGQWLDRLSQVGPGSAPTFNATSTEYDIESITQPAAVTNGSTGNPIRALLWSSGPGVKNQAGTVITVEYTLSTNPPDPNIYVGGGVVLAGFRVINGNDPNGSYIVVSVQTTNTGNSTRNSFSVTAPTSFNTYDDPPSGASYESSLATLTLTAPAQGVQVGTQILIAGASPSAWNATWTILNALNAAQMTINSTQLSGNTATYDYTLISGTNPVAGQQVTVTNTDNGNGIFNVTNAIITAASPGSFSVEIDAPDVTPAAETGQAIVNGTTFTFDPGPSFVGPSPSTPTSPFIIGNFTGTGATIVQQGQLGAGPRKGVVMFLTRNGLLTAPSPYDNFTLTSGAASITANNIPIGPPNVIARVIALTGANGGFFFWLPEPVQVISNGQTVTYDATIIHDNTTTSATFNLTDAVLLNGLSIDTPGSNNFAQVELGSCIGVTSYAGRLFAWGVNNITPNFINLSFDGGFVQQNPATPIFPAGWTVDPVSGAGGILQTSPLFGQSYYIKNTTGSTQAALGMITQTAFQDQLGTPIIEVQTNYSVRVTARCPSGVSSGNLVVDLFSPSFGQVGSFSVPLASMTDTMQIFTGTLLTTAFTTTVPNDLLLRIYAQNIPNGGDVELDRIEPFDSAQPVDTTELSASYFNNFEAFDGVTGKLGVGIQNQQPVRNTFSLFDNLYVVKTKSFYSTVDNGITEPYLWNVKEVSNKVGTPSIFGVDVGEGWALIVGEPGVYVFMGGAPVKISPELDGNPGLWQSVSWKYGNTIWVRNDTNSRKFYVGVPIPTPNQWMPKFEANANPTEPNVVLMCNYKELMTAGALSSEGPLRQTYMGDLKTMALGRKWSAWSIQAAYADFIDREDQTDPLFYCGDTNSAKIYQQISGQYNDDGAALHCFYVTYPFPKTSEAQQMHMGLHELLAKFMSMTIRGGGMLRLTLFPNDITSPYAEAQDPIPLADPPPWGDTEQPLNIEGDRFFVGFEVRDPDEWFELSKVIMAIGENPWAPVRGSNM